MFWKVFHDFVEFRICDVKTAFSTKKVISGEIPHLEAQNQFFRPWASKKAPRTLRLSLLLGGWPQGPVMEPNERFSGPKHQNEGISPISSQMGRFLFKGDGSYLKCQVFP